MRYSLLTIFLALVPSISCIPHSGLVDVRGLSSDGGQVAYANNEVAPRAAEIKVIMAIKDFKEEKLPLLFLAGSMAKKGFPDWRKVLISKLSSFANKFTVLDPSPSNWTPEWDTNPKDKDLIAQVKWELNGMTAAKVLAIYFEDFTQSPISLMELGLFARGDSKKLVVGTAPKYAKKANVMIVCEKYGVTLVEGQEKFAEAVKAKLQ